MHRRDLLTLAPLAVVGFVSPARAACALSLDETPVRRAFNEWKAYRDHINGPATSGMPDEVFEGLCDTRRDMEEAMRALPSESVEDVMLKLLALNDNGNDFSDDHWNTGQRLLIEARDMMGVPA